MKIARIAAGIAVALLLAALLAGCGSSTSSSSSATTSSTTSAARPASGARVGFEGVPIETGTPIAPAGTTGTARVDGITCAPTEQLAYHIHAHLMVYVHGSPRSLPGGIGIPGSLLVDDPQAGPVAEGGQCIYWLHTHAPDGVIHIESPTRRIYTLGTFFDEWRQPLGPTVVGTARGRVTAVVDGHRWTRDVRTIRLTPHAVIELSVGTPVPPHRPVNWGATQL